MNITNKRAGDFLFPDIQMSESAVLDSKPFDVYNEDWYIHFAHVQNKSTRDITEPAIYKNKRTCLRGGLKPKGADYPKAGTEYVYFKDETYKLVDMADIRMPTENEYNNFFRKMYGGNYPYINRRTRRKGKSLPLVNQYAVIEFKRTK